MMGYPTNTSHCCVPRVSNVALSADVACITFGAPLVGGAELSRLVRSKGWDGLIHQVVWRHDLVPRVLLSLGTGAAHQNL